MDDIDRAAQVAIDDASAYHELRLVLAGRLQHEAMLQEQAALRIAEKIRALPRSEWRDRMPTAEELKVHAATHGRRGRGMWHVGITDDGDIRCVSVTVWPGYHPGGWTCTRPCAWDGTPVPWPDAVDR